MTWAQKISLLCNLWPWNNLHHSWILVMLSCVHHPLGTMDRVCQNILAFHAAARGAGFGILCRAGVGWGEELRTKEKRPEACCAPGHSSARLGESPDLRLLTGSEENCAMPSQAGPQFVQRSHTTGSRRLWAPEERELGTRKTRKTAKQSWWLCVCVFFFLR